MAAIAQKGQLCRSADAPADVTWELISSIIVPVTVDDGSAVNGATGLPTDKYTSRLSFVDIGPIPNGFSGDKFKAVHYVIETQGISGRNAADKHKQGTYVVNQIGPNQDSFKPMGAACYTPISGSWP